jgi:hypothetical protein
LRFGKNEEPLPRDGDAGSLLKHQTCQITDEKNRLIKLLCDFHEKYAFNKKKDLPIFLNHTKSGQSLVRGAKK